MYVSFHTIAVFFMIRIPFNLGGDLWNMQVPWTDFVVGKMVYKMSCATVSRFKSGLRAFYLNLSETLTADQYTSLSSKSLLMGFPLQSRLTEKNTSMC